MKINNSLRNIQTNAKSFTQQLDKLQQRFKALELEEADVSMQSPEAFKTSASGLSPITPMLRSASLKSKNGPVEEEVRYIAAAALNGEHSAARLKTVMKEVRSPTSAPWNKNVKTARNRPDIRRNIKATQDKPLPSWVRPDRERAKSIGDSSHIATSLVKKSGDGGSGAPKTEEPKLSFAPPPPPSYSWASPKPAAKHPGLANPPKVKPLPKSATAKLAATKPSPKRGFGLNFDSD